MEKGRQECIPTPGYHEALICSDPLETISYLFHFALLWLFLIQEWAPGQGEFVLPLHRDKEGRGTVLSSGCEALTLAQMASVSPSLWLVCAVLEIV